MGHLGSRVIAAEAAAIICLAGCGVSDRTPTSISSPAAAVEAPRGTQTISSGRLRAPIIAVSTAHPIAVAVRGATVSSSATITLTGALSGTFDGTATDVLDSNGLDTFGITTAPSAGITVALQKIVGTGLPLGSWRSTDPAAAGAVICTRDTGVWMGSIGTNRPSMGGYTLTVNSATYVVINGTEKAYTVHGSLTASLDPVPGSGASGTVDLQAVF